MNFKKLFFVAFIISGCSAEVKNKPEEPLPKTLAERLPSYEKQQPRGQLFGESWIAQKAVIRTLRSSSGSPINQVSILPDTSVDRACSLGSIGDRPYALVTVPKIEAGIEFATDLEANVGDYPIVLVNPKGEQITNVISQKSKFKILEKNATGFRIQIYAEGVEPSGRPFSINGEIEAEDCRFVASFQDWMELQNLNLQLLEIDGEDVSQINYTTTVRLVSGLYRDPQLGFPVRAVLFPVVGKSIERGISVEDFGPIEGFGTAKKMPQADGTNVFLYQYRGLVLKSGQTKMVDVSLQVHFRRVGLQNRLQIKYTLEMVGEGPKSSHTTEYLVF